MTIYIATKSRKTAWARPPVKKYHSVDVTSAQPKHRIYRKGFSPMHVEDDARYSAPDGADYACFENWWQSRKVWEHEPHEKTLKWWQQSDKPHRRYKNTINKRPLHSVDPRQPGTRIGYVASRKQIYVPDYTDKLQNSAGKAAIKQVREEMKKGDVVIFDFDGPKNRDGEPLCKEVTVDLLKTMLNDETHPFGHGYIVAAAVLGISPKEYTS